MSYCLFTVIKGVGFFALSSLIAFAAWSHGAGILILMFLSSLSGLILKTVQGLTMLPFYDLSFSGLLEASFNGFNAGNFGWQLIPAVLIYVVGVTALSMHLFNRKEIDL